MDFPLVVVVVVVAEEVVAGTTTSVARPVPTSWKALVAWRTDLFKTPA